MPIFPLYSDAVRERFAHLDLPSLRWEKGALTIGEWEAYAVVAGAVARVKARYPDDFVMRIAMREELLDRHLQRRQLEEYLHHKAAIYGLSPIDVGLSS